MQKHMPVLPCVRSVSTARAYRVLHSGALVCCSVESAAGDPGLLTCCRPFQCGCHWTALGPRCFRSMVAVRI